MKNRQNRAVPLRAGQRGRCRPVYLLSESAAGASFDCEDGSVDSMDDASVDSVAAGSDESGGAMDAAPGSEGSATGASSPANAEPRLTANTTAVIEAEKLRMRVSGLW
jgi:hypothetical protein